ncbi:MULTISPECIES: acyl-CoA dehydrogenase family protein [unclassified Nocardioides]|uniref:acyl-CoA dehydrogenase family protein n=1 Tax=unclassified Nocardioides TaxID=2615069 RepID=UPI001305106F|nr:MULTISPECIES: acyl-CoA dehydrogenase family protein [unclassified Nocardioides]
MSEFESQFIGAGWLEIGTPEGLGGRGGGLLALALTAEELSRATAPSGAWLSTVLAVDAVARHEVLDRALLGEGAAWLIPAFGARGGATLEISAAGDLTGCLPGVLAGDTARWLVAPVRCAHGPQLRLVDATDARVCSRAYDLLDPSRTLAHLSLDRVPSEPLDGPAVALLAATAARANVLLAADVLGAVERLVEVAAGHGHGVPRAVRASLDVLRGAVHRTAHAIDSRAGRATCSMPRVVPPVADLAQWANTAGGLVAAAVATMSRGQRSTLRQPLERVRLDVHLADGLVGNVPEHDRHLVRPRRRQVVCRPQGARPE